jgi:hypothetical protein
MLEARGPVCWRGRLPGDWVPTTGLNNFDGLANFLPEDGSRLDADQNTQS